MADASIDNVLARNSTKVFIQINGARVGRVQQFSETINNNVQVLTELGRAYAAELKKGITTYSFSIARFYCHSDVLEPLKLGAIFSLLVRDAGDVAEDGLSGVGETLELFQQCAINTISREITNGQASIVENAQVVTIGKGITSP